MTVPITWAKSAERLVEKLVLALHNPWATGALFLTELILRWPSRCARNRRWQCDPKCLASKTTRESSGSSC